MRINFSYLNREQGKVGPQTKGYRKVAPDFLRMRFHFFVWTFLAGQGPVRIQKGLARTQTSLLREDSNGVVARQGQIFAQPQLSSHIDAVTAIVNTNQNQK